jgi:hypothetical protein
MRSNLDRLAPARRLLLLGAAAAALAGTVALDRAEAEEAPCGKNDGNLCMTVEVCGGLLGNKACWTFPYHYQAGSVTPQ